MYDKRIIFMYSGQGTQYYNMGKEFYATNKVFKASMDRCNKIALECKNVALLENMYSETKTMRQFDNILYTNPALLSIGYSLTQVLYSRGIYPDGVLGYSLGEYTAAIVSGIISLEEGLIIGIELAQLLQRRSCQEGMLAVLDQVATFQEKPRLFQDCTLAAINYEGHFVVSGPLARLKEIQIQLDNQAIVSQLLPVSYAFHSALIEPIQEDFELLLKQISLQPPQLPFYSCVKACALAAPTKQHFWEIVRERIQFHALATWMQKQQEYTYIDVGPSGTLASFIRRGFGEQIPSFVIMDQFGQNNRTLSKLVANLGY